MKIDNVIALLFEVQRYQRARRRADSLLASDRHQSSVPIEVFDWQSGRALPGHDALRDAVKTYVEAAMPTLIETALENWYESLRIRLESVRLPTALLDRGEPE